MGCPISVTRRQNIVVKIYIMALSRSVGLLFISVPERSLLYKKRLINVFSRREISDTIRQGFYRGSLRVEERK